MSSTKIKILKTSLDLFNQYGVQNISQRKITENLGISPGNLTYHFKKKQDIEEALYFQLVENISRELASINEPEINLKHMFNLTNTILTSFFEYRFIMLDFVHLMRTNKKIAQFHQGLSKQRTAQITGLIQQLVDQDILRPEELENEYENLYIRFQILSDFWISAAEINEEGIKSTHFMKYKTIIIQSIYPYLTKKGQLEYKMLFN